MTFKRLLSWWQHDHLKEELRQKDVRLKAEARHIQHLLNEIDRGRGGKGAN